MSRRWMPADPFWPSTVLDSACTLVFLLGLAALSVGVVSLTIEPDSPVPVSETTRPYTTPPLSYPEPLRGASDANPFHPDRRPPAVRLGEAPDARLHDPTPLTEAGAPRVRLAGIGLVPGGRSFAVLVRDGVPARLVREGETWGDVRIDRVAGSAVTLSTTTGVVTLTWDGGDE